MNQRNRQALNREINNYQGATPPTKSHLCLANPDCETCVICHTTGMIICFDTPIMAKPLIMQDVRGFLGALQHGGEDAGREFLKAWEAKRNG